MNQQLIARLRNGEIAAENNGTLEQLREVLKAAFPEDDCEAGGDWKYYSRDPWQIEEWVAYAVPRTPTVPITDFFKEDRAVELLREAYRRLDLYDHGESLFLSEIEQFLNELNK